MTIISCQLAQLRSIISSTIAYGYWSIHLKNPKIRNKLQHLIIYVCVYIHQFLLSQIEYLHDFITYIL